MRQKLHFWYSEKQNERLIELGSQGTNECLIEGSSIPTKYTTASSSNQHDCKWDDLVYLGQGVITKSKTN